jgi:hypothetical protein
MFIILLLLNLLDASPDSIHEFFRFRAVYMLLVLFYTKYSTVYS